MSGNGTSKSAIPTTYKDISVEIPEDLQSVLSSQDEFVDFLRETHKEKFNVRIRTVNSWSFAGDIETPIEITDLIDRFGNEYLLFSRPKMQIKDWSKTLNLREHPYKKVEHVETPVVTPMNSNNQGIEQLTGMFATLLEKQEKQHREMLMLQERLLTKQQTPVQDVHLELEKQLTLFERFAKLQNPQPITQGVQINDLIDVRKIATQAVQLGMSLQNPNTEPKEESMIEKLLASPIAPKIVETLGNLFAPATQQPTNNREAELVAVIQRQQAQINQLSAIANQRNTQKNIEQSGTAEKENVVQFPENTKTEGAGQELELLKIRNIINELVAKQGLSETDKETFYNRFKLECPKMLAEIIAFADGTAEQIDTIYNMTNNSDNFADMINYIMVKNGKEPYYSDEPETVE